MVGAAMSPQDDATAWQAPKTLNCRWTPKDILKSRVEELKKGKGPDPWATLGTDAWAAALGKGAHKDKDKDQGGVKSKGVGKRPATQGPSPSTN